jgi:archaellum component FlaD/FlaE
MSGSDDLGGLGDLDDADDDMGDLDDGGEGLGGLDDGGFDEMGGEEMGGDEMGGDGGGNLDELEHRLDELENEVGSLSSTVNTVRNENEQISESVEEVEENVRKLLDIYEMVTRGVNPFADEVDAGMGMGGEMEDSSFGLFTDEGEEESTESVDEDITEADAEGFFDDDLVEEDDGDDLGGDAADMLEDDDAGDTFDEADDAGDTFDEADDAFQTDDGDVLEDEPEDAFQEPVEDATDDGEAATTEPEDVEGVASDEAQAGAAAAEESDLADDELFDQEGEEDQSAGPQTSPGGADQPASAETEGPDNPVEDGAGKPYLARVPNGLGAELIVVEWLEYLVDAVGRRAASRAIDYYESVGWISETVADRLASYLAEFQFATAGDGSLGAALHLQSLAFIEQLNGGDAGTADATSVEVLGP